MLAYHLHHASTEASESPADCSQKSILCHQLDDGMAVHWSFLLRVEDGHSQKPCLYQIQVNPIKNQANFEDPHLRVAK
jgi:hypothetical protein